MVLVFGWLTPVGLETETACARSLIFNGPGRSEEHTSELQSQSNLVCRLLLEKKKERQHLCCGETTQISQKCEELRLLQSVHPFVSLRLTEISSHTAILGAALYECGLILLPDT